MSDSVELFADHPINVARRKAGKLPATNVWLWGLGSMPHLESFAELPDRSVVYHVDHVTGKQPVTPVRSGN